MFLNIQMYFIILKEDSQQLSGMLNLNLTHSVNQ